jgi:hypothetical protein
MANYLIFHVDLGELDIRTLPGDSWRQLLDDRRLPLALRGIQCGGICRDLGYVEWMHVYERDGLRIAAHQSKTADRRHTANVSDEHKAYQDRTVRVAEEAGHRASAEVYTADRKVRSDVLIYGATSIPTAFEIQRSYETDQSIRRRNKAASDHGILDAWHTDQRQMFNRNEVAWTRTDNDLPPRAIRDGAHLRIRGGFRLLDMERCDERRARPCPTKRTGKCGKWHPVSSPTEVPYDDFVRGVAAGELVQAAVKEFRETFRFWTAATELERYEDSLGESARPKADVQRKPTSTSTSTDDPTCRTRPRIEVSSGPNLDWRRGRVGKATPCVLCGSPALMRNPDTHQPMHKTCAEAQAGEGR